MDRNEILQNPRFQGIEPFEKKVWLSSPAMHGEGIISLYHYRQKKEEADKVGESRKTEGSQGTKDDRGAKEKRETKCRRAEENPEMGNSRELCVVCGRETEYARETPISRRRGYIEGAGQLCRRCFAEIYADGQL